ncbi:hypothetical protein PILCRDRAFT_234160 [Piloderma croceum F 1598]|uniref:Uncharacterized protein n=1 Tax=Piloderma croceum (strain F 1598) TaxID=765440 RepID=A0A0C3CG05_PILCF|nr:hypothetical protein PILCRDRAFT_234160 [Piloderma croceum F 1598]
MINDRIRQKPPLVVSREITASDVIQILRWFRRLFSARVVVCTYRGCLSVSHYYYYSQSEFPAEIQIHCRRYPRLFWYSYNSYGSKHRCMKPPTWYYRCYTNHYPDLPADEHY